MVEQRPGPIGGKTALLSAMSNPRRLQILHYLSLGDMPAGALSEKVGISRSALSPHLARLRRSGLIRTRRCAKTVYYSACSDAVTMMLHTLSAIVPAIVAEDIHRYRSTRT